ncbi:hypothetical protein ZOSMA_12G00700 [Zostera marina]|uniref:HTH myb-type domain-containing protein n=1 Tax=Zostera marina TaxID=29655 RepID=A0A0K9PZM5_ZOSMR|nr:hypothetical protein ZOSMA_12G00700 [Zostera marina]
MDLNQPFNSPTGIHFNHPFNTPTGRISNKLPSQRYLQHKEDAKINELVEKYGCKNWSLIEKSIKGRIGKQCMQRQQYFNESKLLKLIWTKLSMTIALQQQNCVGRNKITCKLHLEQHRENEKRNIKFQTICYRDGLIAGKEASAQEAFNVGFKESVVVGYKFGLVRGVTSTLYGLPKHVKDKLSGST